MMGDTLPRRPSFTSGRRRSRTADEPRTLNLEPVAGERAGRHSEPGEESHCERDRQYVVAGAARAESPRYGAVSACATGRGQSALTGPVSAFALDGCSRYGQAPARAAGRCARRRRWCEDPTSSKQACGARSGCPTAVGRRCGSGSCARCCRASPCGCATLRCRPATHRSARRSARGPWCGSASRRP